MGGVPSNAPTGSAGAGGMGGTPAVGGMGGTGMAGGGMGGFAGMAGGSGGSGGMASAEFELSSPVLMSSADCSLDDIPACPVFPPENTFLMGAANESPELNWGPGPEGTQSYAITLHDLSNGFTHWAIWNISADVQQLPAAAEQGANPSEPAGATQVSFQQHNGYVGPGANDHVYEFTIYALSSASFQPSNANDQGVVYEDLLASPDVLASATLRAASAP